MTPDLEKLIDHARIAEAEGRLALAKERRVAAQAELAAGEQAHGGARHREGHALSGGGQDVRKAIAETRAAADEVELLRKIDGAASQGVVTAEAGVIRQRSLAWRPVYREGVSMRLAAARKADAARAMLAEADADYSAGTAVLVGATHEGVEHVIWDAGHTAPLVDFETERRRWSVGYHVNWWPGLNEDGDVLPLPEVAS